MYDTILVAVDSSEHSDRAVLAARDLASLSKGKVRLLHVRERQVILGKFGGSFDTEEPEDVEQLFAKEIAVFEQAGVPVTAVVGHAPVGHAAHEIVAAAKADEADVIVMGSHGRSSLGALVLGSNAYKVLHLTDRPVLVVR
jgi:nucleotide-binding universal stress UspA family protein